MGKFCFDVTPSSVLYQQDALIALSQLRSILNLSQDQIIIPPDMQ